MCNQSVGLSPIQGVIMEPLKERRAEEFGVLSLYVRKVVIIMTPSRLQAGTGATTFKPR